MLSCVESIYDLDIITLLIYLKLIFLLSTVHLSLFICEFQIYVQDLHTALHVSARQGDAAAVRLLIQRGASPNSVTSDLNTPMHGAAREGHAEVVDILVNNAGNMTALNKVYVCQLLIYFTIIVIEICFLIKIIT